MSKLLEQQNKKIYPLVDLAPFVSRGITPKYVESDGLHVLNQKCIREWRVSYDQSRLTLKNTSIGNKLLQENDILICSTGVGTLGRVAQLSKVENPTTVDSHVSIVRPDSQKVNPVFLGYILKKSEKLIESLAEGSTGQTELPRTKLQGLEVEIPARAFQDQVVRVLNAYDEKMENNNKIIRNLETTAQTLFNEWFVNFRFPGYEKAKMVDSEMGEIPEGWMLGKFTDFISVLGGGTPKTEVQDYWNGPIPFFTPKDAGTGFYCLQTEKSITDAGLKSCSSKLYPRNTVFITARGTVGKLALSGVPMAMNQSCYALKGKDDISSLFILLMTRNLITELQQVAIGGVFDTITTSTFENTEVLVPRQQLMNDFDGVVKPIFQKVLSLSLENSSLKELRNHLLAKLI